MNRYMILVKFKDEPGAGFAPTFIMASNAYQAIQLAKAQYGRLLMSESAVAV